MHAQAGMLLNLVYRRRDDQCNWLDRFTVEQVTMGSYTVISIVAKVTASHEACISRQNVHPSGHGLEPSLFVSTCLHQPPVPWAASATWGMVCQW